MEKSLWLQALKVIPRVSKERWETLDVITRWLIASRSAVFVMTISSCLIGAILAIQDGYFDTFSFVFCLLGLVLSHATNNLLNDLTDYRRGIDKDNYFRALYGPQTLEHGLLSERSLWLYIIVTGGLAILCGALLVSGLGETVLWFMLAGAFFVIFYTWPLKYWGLGEPAVWLVWGPLMIGGSYYVVSGGQWNNDILVLASIYALGPTTVLMGKHTDKLLQDKDKGVHTLPVVLGEWLARKVTVGMWVVQYAWLVFQIVDGEWIWCLPLLALPDFIKNLKFFNRSRPVERPADYPEEVWPLYFVRMAFAYNRRFTGFFILSLLLSHWL